jgi:ATP-dependent DNA helicase 2 subunit 2
MAGKEATIFIIDQGASMGKKNNGRGENDLDFAMRYVWDKFAEVMIAARKTLFVGIIGLRTDKTAHSLIDDEGYNNISIMQELEPMYMPQLKRLQREIRVSRTENGDAISAIILAIDMMEKFTKKLKYKRKIVLVTDGRGLMDGDDLEQVTDKLNEIHIELVVMYAFRIVSSR